MGKGEENADKYKKRLGKKMMSKVSCRKQAKIEGRRNTTACRDGIKEEGASKTDNEGGRENFFNVAEKKLKGRWRPNLAGARSKR